MPEEDGSQYLAVWNPYPQTNLEAVNAPRTFARWFASALGTHAFLYTIYHKPSSPGIVIVEVGEEFKDKHKDYTDPRAVGWRPVLGEHKWSEFLKKPRVHSKDYTTCVFFSRYQSADLVRKDGWKIIDIQDDWFEGWTPENGPFQYPYPKTRWCAPPRQDVTTSHICKALPERIYPAPPRDVFRPTVGSQAYVDLKVPKDGNRKSAELPTNDTNGWSSSDIDPNARPRIANVAATASPNGQSVSLENPWARKQRQCQPQSSSAKTAPVSFAKVVKTSMAKPPVYPELEPSAPLGASRTLSSAINNPLHAPSTKASSWLSGPPGKHVSSSRPHGIPLPPNASIALRQTSSTPSTTGPTSRNAGTNLHSVNGAGSTRGLGRTSASGAGVPTEDDPDDMQKSGDEGEESELCRWHTAMGARGVGGTCRDCKSKKLKKQREEEAKTRRRQEAEQREMDQPSESKVDENGYETNSRYSTYHNGDVVHDNERNDVKGDDDDWNNFYLGEEEEEDDPILHGAPSVGALMTFGANTSKFGVDGGDATCGAGPSNARYAAGPSGFGSSTTSSRSATYNGLQAAVRRLDITERSVGAVNDGTGGAWQSQSGGLEGNRGKGKGKAKFENSNTGISFGRNVPGSPGWTTSKRR